jgi:hypothetical protein
LLPPLPLLLLLLLLLRRRRRRRLCLLRLTFEQPQPLGQWHIHQTVLLLAPPLVALLLLTILLIHVVPHPLLLLLLLRLPMVLRPVSSSGDIPCRGVRRLWAYVCLAQGTSHR